MAVSADTVDLEVQAMLDIARQTIAKYPSLVMSEDARSDITRGMR
jgi:hypothetical protein